MTLAQLAILAAFAERQLPDLAKSLGAMLEGSLTLTGFVLRPASDDDYDDETRDGRNANDWAFEVHAIGGVPRQVAQVCTGVVAGTMTMSFAEKLTRDEVIERLGRNTADEGDNQ